MDHRRDNSAGVEKRKKKKREKNRRKTRTFTHILYLWNCGRGAERILYTTVRVRKWDGGKGRGKELVVVAAWLGRCRGTSISASIGLKSEREPETFQEKKRKKERRLGSTSRTS